MKTRNMPYRCLMLTLLSLTAILYGCARLDYVKVPTPTQYSEWTDQQQKKADDMKGVRYYLPRPFLHLKQSVPVAQRVAFITFALETRTVNGKSEQGYYLQMPADAPTWLRRLAPQRISVTQALAASLFSARPPREDDHKDGEETAPLGGEPDKDTKDADVRPPSELTARTGFISDTDPVTRLGDLMDVVYLPDFEEQYVIQSHTGIGKADIETRLRNGWAAEVFSLQIDNSNFVPYVIRQVERASEAAVGIAATWMPTVMTGLPPANLAELASAVTGEEESALFGADGTIKAEDILGQVIMFKIAEVKMAQPGVYPILKPREIRQWLKTDMMPIGIDPQDTFELYLGQNNLPWIRPDMAFIPCPPFTVVGFNVTSDAFLMPATERLDTSSRDVNLPDNGDPWEKNKETIENALTATFADEMPQPIVAKFKEMDDTYNLTAEKVKDGAKTKITIKTKEVGTAEEKELTKEEQNVDTFTTWVKETFDINSQITVTFPKKTVVEIIVTMPSDRLAKSRK